MDRFEVIEDQVEAATDTVSSAYVPPLQLTEGQPPPIAANGGLSYLSFDRDGDAGTAAATEAALVQIAEGEGQAVIDMLDTILTNDDPELTAMLKAVLEKEGVEYVLGAGVKQVAQTDGAMAVVVEQNGQKRIIEADALLMATGRRATSRGWAWRQRASPTPGTASPSTTAAGPTNGTFMPSAT